MNTNRYTPSAARCSYCPIIYAGRVRLKRCVVCVGTLRCPIPEPEVLGGKRRRNWPVIFEGDEK